MPFIPTPPELQRVVAGDLGPSPVTQAFEALAALTKEETKSTQELLKTLAQTNPEITALMIQSNPDVVRRAIKGDGIKGLFSRGESASDALLAAFKTASTAPPPELIRLNAEKISKLPDRFVGIVGPKNFAFLSSVNPELAVESMNQGLQALQTRDREKRAALMAQALAPYGQLISEEGRELMERFGIAQDLNEWTRAGLSDDELFAGQFGLKTSEERLWARINQGNKEVLDRLNQGRLRLSNRESELRVSLAEKLEGRTLIKDTDRQKMTGSFAAMRAMIRGAEVFKDLTQRQSLFINKFGQALWIEHVAEKDAVLAAITAPTRKEFAGAALSDTEWKLLKPINPVLGESTKVQIDAGIFENFDIARRQVTETLRFISADPTVHPDHLKFFQDELKAVNREMRVFYPDKIPAGEETTGTFIPGVARTTIRLVAGPDGKLRLEAVESP